MHNQNNTFNNLLVRYQTAWFELNDYETQILPSFENGKVVNCKTIISLEEFESTIEVMEELVRREAKELSSDNLIQQEEGRSFFNWFTLAHIVQLIKAMAEKKNPAVHEAGNT